MLIVYDHRNGDFLQYGLFMKARDGFVNPFDYEKGAKLSDSYFIVPRTWDEVQAEDWERRLP